ncbi:MAG: hypothetical protein PHG07_08020 [Lachnospiraceae bacterium]|nr:hypothetical protein [Lachnospiraceae bacterium]
MAYKKDIKPWLKENGFAWEDMNKFWDECCEVNWKCKMIKKSGKSWNDMTMYQIQQLPTLKETTLQQIREKEEEELLKAKEEQKKKNDEQYYYEHFKEIMVQKIDSGEELTENELQGFQDFEVERTKGENRRWSRTVSSICKLCDRFFKLVWEEGLTECQENEFYDQPYEVEKRTYEKKITVTEWVKK